jgi:hypothetical protein
MQMDVFGEVTKTLSERKSQTHYCTSENNCFCVKPCLRVNYHSSHILGVTLTFCHVECLGKAETDISSQVMLLVGKLAGFSSL